MKHQIFTKTGIVIYVVSALAFLSEAIREMAGFLIYKSDSQLHELIEITTILGFFVGGYLLWHSHQKLLKRYQEIEYLLQAAQGEFFAMMQLQFDRWGLSEAEKDVALLTLKGLSVADIATARNTSQGTIKSQNNAIYRKANVKSRAQLLSVVIDELLVEKSPSEEAQG